MERPSSEVDASALANELHTAGDRLARLVDESLADGDWAPDRVRMVLAEVSVGIEELRVAEEELLAQSEQVLAAHRLVEAERERYAGLFEFAPDAYLETDIHGKVFEANEAACRLFGVPGRFMPGKLVHTFVGVEDRHTVRARLVALADGAPGEDVVIEITPRDAPPAWADVRMVAHEDRLTGALRVRWLLRDITERRKLDRELGQLHASVELLQALNNVAHLVESDDNVDAVLTGLVELAQRATGAEAAAILVRGSHQPSRVASSPGVTELCDLELREGGPALAAIQRGEPVEASGDALEAWPELAAAARAAGVSYVMAQPIMLASQPVGALVVYGADPVRETSNTAKLLVDHAATAVANAQLYAGARELAAQLSIALESRGIIDQAKGILMSTQHCTADEAFEILRRASQRENRKLRAIAEDIVARVVHEAGEPPN